MPVFQPLAIAQATPCALLLALGLSAVAAEMVPLPTGDSAQAMAEAAVFLRTNVFPAEIQFQAGGYVDPDGNRCGAYAILPELAGGTAANGQGRCQRPMAFLPEAFANPEVVVGGWRYAVILPGDPALRQSVATLPDLAQAGAKGEALRERHFACLAWRQGRAGSHLLVMGGSGQVAWAPWDGADPRALSAEAMLGLDLHAYEAGGPRAAAVNAGSLVPWLQSASGPEAANAAAVEIRCKHDLYRLMDALVSDRPGPGWGFRLKTLLRAGDGTPGNPQFFTLRNTWVGAGRIRQNEMAGEAKDKLTYARFVLYDGQETMVQDALSGSRSGTRGDSVPMPLAVHCLVELRSLCLGSALRKPVTITWFALQPQHRAWLDAGLGLYDEAGSIAAEPRVACQELRDLPAGERGYRLEARIGQPAGTAVRQVIFPAGGGVLPLRIASALKGKEADADVFTFDGRIATAHLAYPKSVRLTGRLQTGSGLVCEEEVLELEEVEMAVDDPVFNLATPVDGVGGFLHK